MQDLQDVNYKKLADLNKKMAETPYAEWAHYQVQNPESLAARALYIDMLVEQLIPNGLNKNTCAKMVFAAALCDSDTQLKEEVSCVFPKETADYFAGTTPEARFVFDIGQVQRMTRAFEYDKVHSGHPFLSDEVSTSALTKLKTKLGSDVFLNVLRQYKKEIMHEYQLYHMPSSGVLIRDKQTIPLATSYQKVCE